MKKMKGKPQSGRKNRKEKVESQVANAKFNSWWCTSFRFHTGRTPRGVLLSSQRTFLNQSYNHIHLLTK